MDAGEIPRAAPCDAKEAVGGERGEHRIEGVAQPADRADVDLIDSVEPVERHCPVDGLKTVADRCGIVGKEGDELRGKKGSERRHDERSADREPQACPHARADAIRLLCPHILPDEARQRNAECEQRIVEKTLDAGVDRHACHCGVAERVDIPLDDERGDAHKDCLHPRGDTRVNDRCEITRVKERTAQAELPYAMQVEKFLHDERGGDVLRDDSRDRRTHDAERENDEEEHVERDVEDHRDEEVAERTRRVAERAQDGGHRVVDKLREHPEEGDLEVRGGERYDVLRRIEPCEHRRDEREPAERKDNGEEQHDDENRLHERVQLFIGLLAVEV